jgi:tetrapyrrole methylase family protein/MazG family protein
MIKHINSEIFKTSPTQSEAFSRLAEIVQILRSPEGCPWDKEQTIESLAPQLLEEAYEVIDGIKNKHVSNIREELGDMYLVVTMIAKVLSEHEEISLADILNEVSDKLIRRHPHVFSAEIADTSEEVIHLWNSVKENIEGKKKSTSILSTVKRSIPPLERAYQLQKKASKAGFDWTESHDVWEKIQEEFDELFEAVSSNNMDHAEEEMGDFLFSVINICRFLDIDPAIALHRTNNKFIDRFEHVELRMSEADLELSQDNMEKMEHFWQEAKILLAKE